MKYNKYFYCSFLFHSLKYGDDEDDEYDEEDEEKNEWYKELREDLETARWPL